MTGTCDQCDVRRPAGDQRPVTAARIRVAIISVRAFVSDAAVIASAGVRPGSSGTSEVRILFIFDPARNPVLLIAGDKSGRWQEWYREAIPAAEAIYEAYLKEQP